MGKIIDGEIFLIEKILMIKKFMGNYFIWKIFLMKKNLRE